MVILNFQPCATAINSLMENKATLGEEEKRERKDLFINNNTKENEFFFYFVSTRIRVFYVIITSYIFFVVFRFLLESWKRELIIYSLIVISNLNQNQLDLKS